MARVGFVGLGVMVGRIAKRLLDAGHQVTGHNRTRAKADWLLAEGMGWADWPRAAAEAAEVTFSMVTGTQALRAVTGGPDGVLAGLGPGKVYVDMSTVSPTVSQELAGRVAERGAAMLDAPVSGSVVTLEEGRLSIMVGGDRAVLDRVLPVLQAGRELDVPLPTTAASNQRLTAARAMGLQARDFATVFTGLARMSG